MRIRNTLDYLEKLGSVEIAISYGGENANPMEQGDKALSVKIIERIAGQITHTYEKRQESFCFNDVFGGANP